VTLPGGRLVSRVGDGDVPGPAEDDGKGHVPLLAAESEKRNFLSGRHTLKMTTNGLAVLSWPVVYRPIHDALIEESLATAEASLGREPRIRHWSFWVRFLRWVVSRGKAPAQEGL